MGACLRESFRYKNEFCKCAVYIVEIFTEILSIQFTKFADSTRCGVGQNNSISNLYPVHSLACFRNYAGQLVSEQGWYF